MSIEDIQLFFSEKAEAWSRKNLIGWLFWALLIPFIVVIFCFKAEAATASYYTVESCKREGTSGITASGELLNDNNLTAAMWGVPFGTLVKVTNINTGKRVVVRINDRGPAKNLVKKGRIIDLSKEAFQRIGDLRQGVITVSVEKTKEGIWH